MRRCQVKASRSISTARIFRARQPLQAARPSSRFHSRRGRAFKRGLGVVAAALHSQTPRFELIFAQTRRAPRSRTVPFGVDCAAPDVAIVVPIYGAPDAVERCLDSVIEHTTGRARLIVIDDASPDDAMAPLLARYATRANVTLLRNVTNRGFTATANRGMAEAGRADVVLLNADTKVGPNWLVGFASRCVLRR